jgi:Ca2+-transporting ATPase
VFLDLISAIQNRGLGCGLFQNKMLITTVLISLVTQLGLVYIGFLQKIFKTDTLDFQDLGIIVALACISFGLHEGRRWLERQKDGDEVYNSVMDELA